MEQQPHQMEKKKNKVRKTKNKGRKMEHRMVIKMDRMDKKVEISKKEMIKIRRNHQHKMNKSLKTYP